MSDCSVVVFIVFDRVGCSDDLAACVDGAGLGEGKITEGGKAFSLAAPKA